MKHYERPVVLASFTIEELVEEAAVCVRYGGGVPGGGVPGGRGPVYRGRSVGPAALPDTGGSELAGGSAVLGGLLAAGASLVAAGRLLARRQR